MASRATCIGELRLPPAVGSLPGMMVKAGPQLEVAVAVRPMTASGGTPPVPGSQERNSHGAGAGGSSCGSKVIIKLTGGSGSQRISQHRHGVHHGGDGYHHDGRGSTMRSGGVHTMHDIARRSSVDTTRLGSVDSESNLKIGRMLLVGKKRARWSSYGGGGNGSKSSGREKDRLRDPAAFLGQTPPMG